MNLQDSSSTIITDTIKRISQMPSMVKQPITNVEQLWGLNMENSKILIPVLVTLLVFTIGQLISWVKSKNERKAEINSIKITIQTWIGLVEPLIILQIKGCDEFVEVAKKSTRIHPERFNFTPMLIDKLQQIELKELIETIMVNLQGDEDKNAEIIFNLVRDVEFLVKIESYMKSNYDTYKTYAITLMTDWNNTLTEFNAVLNNTTKKIDEVEAGCDFRNNIDRIINDFKSFSMYQPMTIIFDELITPLELEIRGYLTKSLNKELALELAYKVEALKTIRLKWNTHNNGNIELTKSYANKIDKTYKCLQVTATQLKTRKLKCFFSIK